MRPELTNPSARMGLLLIPAIFVTGCSASIGRTPTQMLSAPETAGFVAENPTADYCFGYPEGFTHQGDGVYLAVMGQQSDQNPHPGLVWIEVADAQGRTAQDIADEEVDAVGGLNPPRSTVTLGDEEALVLDGMPGQDAVRKVYIVHGAMLYTLTFSPYRSGNEIADAQMETL
jgi:hypothetical protein